MTPIERGRHLVRRGWRSAHRRLSERTDLVGAPGVDHAERNDAFGPDRRLGVLHIPKSAGSSVSSALEAALADRNWCPYDFDPALFGPFRNESVPSSEVQRVLPDPAVLRDHDAASGHYALSTMLVGFERADIVMLLREPRSRLLSLYEYWRGLPPHLRADDSTWAVIAHARELDFDEWLRDPRSAYQSDNVVLRTVLDGHDGIPDDDFIQPGDLAELTRVAMRRVSSLGWVDVVERGPAMWNGLADRIGVSLERPRMNATERRADLPTDVAAIFSDAAAEALYRRTAADRAIWMSVAERRGVAEVQLTAESTWYQRLRATLDAVPAAARSTTRTR